MTNENETQDNEIEIEAEMDAQAETPATAKEAAASAEDKTPAWEAFANGLRAHAESLGLKIEEQKGFIKYENEATGHKLYVARGGRAVKRVDTTLPILGQPNTLPLEKANGKIECHVVPEVEAVKGALTLLASEEFGKLRPSKRAAKAETPSAS